MAVHMTQKTVTFSGLDIVITGTEATYAAKNTPQYYHLCTVKGISSTFEPSPPNYPYPVIAQVNINWVDGQGVSTRLQFDIQDVTNQAGWTADLAGLTQAVADISAAKTTACPGGSGTIEGTLEEILDELRDDATFTEIAVEDTVTGLKYARRTVRNMDTGVITISFNDGDGNPFVPVNPMRILGINDQAVHAEDSLHASGDMGFQMLGVRNDDLGTSLSNTDGDYTPFATDEYGQLYIQDILARAQQAQMIVYLEELSQAIEVDNDPIASNQTMKVGGKAVTTSSYAPGYTAADVVMNAYDKDSGRLLTSNSIDNYASQFRSLTVDSTAQAVKASAGVLLGWNIINLDVVPIYVKIYNIAAASVNPAADAPVRTILLPPSGSVFQEPNCVINTHSTAISVRAVTGSGDTNTTAPATLPIIELMYK